MRREWRHAAAWSAVIVVATSVPLPGEGVLDRPFLLDGFLRPDKLVHFAMYGVLGWLVIRALGAGEGGARLGSFAGALVLMLAFAALDEWHQAWIPSRSPQVVDWMADAVGAIAGATTRMIRSERGGASPGRPTETGDGEPPGGGPGTPAEGARTT